MTMNNGEISNFAYEANAGMNEQQLRKWLVDQHDIPIITPETVMNDQSSVDIPDWLRPKTEPRQPEPLVIESPGDLKTTEELSSWDELWRPTPEEEALPVKSEFKRLVSKGLHVLTDERRLLLLILIGAKPDGTNIDDVYDRYLELTKNEMVEPKTGLHRQINRQINTWLIGNGLAESFLSVQDDSIKTRLTDEGHKLLPLAGHLIDWAVRNGNIKPLLGRPTRGSLPEEDIDTSRVRQNLEQLASLMEGPQKRLHISDFRTQGQGEEYTRIRLVHLIKGRWIIYIPSYKQPESHYPVFVSRDFPGIEKNPQTIEVALKKYISESHSTRPGEMTLHGLLYHRKYMTLSKKAGGNTGFASEVFQEYERLLSKNQIVELRPSNFKVRDIVISRARQQAMSDLISIVRGAESGSERYERLGFKKIMQRLADPSRIIGQLILNANASEGLDLALKP